MSIPEQVAIAIDQLKEEEAEALVQRAISEHVDPSELLTSGVLPGMKKLAEKYASGEYFLGELIVGSDIGNHCIDLISPHLPSKPKTAGVVVIGNVKSDIHSIGYQLVAMQLSLSGYEVHDVGKDTPTIKFIETAKQAKADIIGLSSFLTTSMPYMAELVKYLVDVGLRDSFKVIIGGAIASPEYARSIGADGFAKDCFEAVTLCNELLRAR